MSAMGSHDIHAERRHIRWYVCEGCGARYDNTRDEYDCEERHEQ